MGDSEERSDEGSGVRGCLPRQCQVALAPAPQIPRVPRGVYPEPRQRARNDTSRVAVHVRKLDALSTYTSEPLMGENQGEGDFAAATIRML